ncbi:hypothetical protein [Echinimonas agarilytica]|uniref:Uncharacterized protein n=1 Tax=Echinimonas agarilytica TaxID=1215918 RepID=A0AA42B6J0_9GAMM|nr:hypothetical protein [Echinimonas agarilytica]MCM2678714.1 hypothetical protein [Echinimonas agarilytica]
MKFIMKRTRLSLSVLCVPLAISGCGQELDSANIDQNPDNTPEIVQFITNSRFVEDTAYVGEGTTRLVTGSPIAADNEYLMQSLPIIDLSEDGLAHVYVQSVKNVTATELDPRVLAASNAVIANEAQCELDKSDESLGVPVTDPETGEPVLDENGEPVLEFPALDYLCTETEYYACTAELPTTPEPDPELGEDEVTEPTDGEIEEPTEPEEDVATCKAYDGVLFAHFSLNDKGQIENLYDESASGEEGDMPYMDGFTIPLSAEEGLTIKRREDIRPLESYLNENGEIVPGATDVTDWNLLSYKFIQSYTKDREYVGGVEEGMPGYDFTSGEAKMPQMSAIVTRLKLPDISDDEQGLYVGGQVPEVSQIWGQVFHAVLNVGGKESEFIAQTATRQSDLNPQPTYLPEDTTYRKPGRAVEVQMAALSGFNTQFPIRVSKEHYELDFKLEYAINKVTDSDYVEILSSSEDVAMNHCLDDNDQTICLRQGQTLYLRMTPPEPAPDDLGNDAYYEKTYSVKVEGGIFAGSSGDSEFEDSFALTTYPVWYVPGPDVEVSYPLAHSGTYAETISLRGRAEISEDMYLYTPNDMAPAEEVKLTKVKVYRLSSRDEEIGPDTVLVREVNFSSTMELSQLDEALIHVGDGVYEWDINDIPLSYDGLDAYTTNHLAVVVESNLSREWEGETIYGTSLPQVLDVDRIGEDTLPEDATFPIEQVTVMAIKNLRDITLDSRSNRFYFTDSTAYIDKGEIDLKTPVVWQMPMPSSNATASAPICAFRVKTNKSVANGFGAIQFNHGKPDVGGLMLHIHNNRAKWRYVSDDLVIGGVEGALEEDNTVNVSGRTDNARSAAYDKNGRFFYFNMMDRTYLGLPVIDPKQKGFFGMVEMLTETNAETGLNTWSGFWWQDKEDAYYPAIGHEYTDYSLYNNGVASDVMTFETLATNADGTPLMIEKLKDNGEPVMTIALSSSGELMYDEDGNLMTQPVMVQDTSYDEWAITLDVADPLKDNAFGQEDNWGEILVRKVDIIDVEEGVTPSYDRDRSWELLKLKDKNGLVIRLINATAIAIHDRYQKAYIYEKSTNRILQFNISNLPETQTLILDQVLVDGATSQIPLGAIHNLVIEPGIDAIIAVDKANNALLTIDPLNGDISYLLKTKMEFNASFVKDTDNICEQQ